MFYTLARDSSLFITFAFNSLASIISGDLPCFFLSQSTSLSTVTLKAPAVPGFKDIAIAVPAAWKSSLVIHAAKLA